jgi:phosphoglycerate dehydrogenase-like enzyme
MNNRFQENQPMKKPRVVFLHGLKPRLVEMVLASSDKGWDTIAIDGKMPEAQQIEAVREADFIMLYRAKLSENMLRAATKVRLVQLLAAGYDDMNLPLMRELGIACANNGGANSWAVADQTVLMMLALYRRVLAADRDVRAGRWNREIDGTNTFEMANKVVGILGMGNIGRKVARRVQAFDAVVQYHNRTRLPVAVEQQLNVGYVELDELFRTSDIVSLHSPLTAQTHHVVSRERLATMKPGALIVNTSRGGLIDEAALAAALRDGVIAGAGLDAFDPEPIDPGSPFLKLENVVLSPHSAGTTADTWYRRGRFGFENMKRVWDSQPPESVVVDYDN